MGMWRNGLRVRLKIVWAHARVGSNPTMPTTCAGHDSAARRPLEKNK